MTERDRKLVAVIGLIVLGICLVTAVIGLVILGRRDDAVQDAITGLSTIGAGLTGGFAGWFTRARLEVLDDRPGEPGPPSEETP